MIGRREEYEKMFRLEEKLWWYRILHENVQKVIQQQFPNQRQIQLLDAGCGTGGLLQFLRRRGYTAIRGLDGSEDAVAFCSERGLSVEYLNLNDLAGYRPESTSAFFDVIVCNDVFCYFDDHSLRQLLTQLAGRLKPTGILITNNNAFNVFRGAHDLAVGSQRRFTKQDFERILPGTTLKIKAATYWSLLLSPLILLIRRVQAARLRWGNPQDEPPSDVYMPGTWINEMLYRVVQVERQLFPRTPFGSSLFMVLTKE